MNHNFRKTLDMTALLYDRVTGIGCTGRLRCAVWVALCCGLSWLGFTGRVFSRELRFDQERYTAAYGQGIEMHLTFDAAVPDGLLAYMLRLAYPSNLFDRAATGIHVVPELDYGYFEPPAVRAIDSGSAQVRGFVDMDALPYGGTNFVSITLTVQPGAPGGLYPLTLSIPLENSFIDGTMTSIDDRIALGRAWVHILPFIDENRNHVPDDWELGYYDSLDDSPATVIKQGREVSLRDVYLAGLDPRDETQPMPGFLPVDRAFAIPTVAGRVYHIEYNPDLLDPDGWETVETLDGDGLLQSLTAAWPGFYRFSVRPPGE